MTEETGRGGVPPLRIVDYSLTARATGLSARNVRELRERLESAPEGSLFHHFWRRLLQAGPDDPEDPDGLEYGNDLAEWAARRLKDPVLAERLALVDPLRSAGMDGLRERVLEIVDQRLEEVDGQIAETRPGDAFHFVSDQMVLYETAEAVGTPEELAERVETLPPASLFLHFVDPPGREAPRGVAVDDWIRRFGEEYEPLARALAGLDVFLAGPAELRDRIREAFGRHLPQESGGGRP